MAELSLPGGSLDWLGYLSRVGRHMVVYPAHKMVPLSLLGGSLELLSLLSRVRHPGLYNMVEFTILAEASLASIIWLSLGDAKVVELLT